MFNGESFGSLLIFILVMATSLIITLVLGLVAVMAGVAGTISTNRDNAASVKETNEANLQSVRETNAANAEQANLAYDRSRPQNQIADMVRSGISLPAAMQKIAGGGTYTAPVMQSGTSQASQFNYGGIADAFEHLNSIPSNAMSLRMQEAQLDQIKQSMRLQEESAKRAEQLHQYNLWKEEHGKETATLLDAASRELASLSIDKGIYLKDFRSFEDFVHATGFDLTDTYRNLPHLARVQLQSGYNTQFEQLRSERSQSNADVAAKDAHDLAVKHKRQLQQLIEDFDAAKDARNQEYHARELVSTLESMVSELGISRQEMIESIEAYRGKDGKLHQKPERSISPTMQNFWNTVFDIVPVGSLSEAFFKGLKFGK